MKKFIARGASVAFLSAAAIVPLAGAAQAAEPVNVADTATTWAAHDHDGNRALWHNRHHRRHCRFREDWWWESSWSGRRHFRRHHRFFRRHHRFFGPGLGFNRGWDWSPFGGGRGFGGIGNVVVVF